VAHCSSLRGLHAGELNLSDVTNVGVAETPSRRGYRYVTVFLEEPVAFALPGCGKYAIKAFSAFLNE